MSDILKDLPLFALAKLDGFFALGNRRGRLRLATSALVFCLFLLSRVAGAQSATVTTLTATAANPVSGSIVTMTANVSSGGQPVMGGTVTFQDTHMGAAQDLGTVQVQSANGTPGLAILKTEVGGVGAHSIVAIYNAPKTYSSSTSAPAALTFQSPYSSATALAVTGSGGTYTLTGTLSAFGPMQPTGSLTFTDTTTNSTIGTAALDPTTATQGFTSPTLYQIPIAQPWGSYSMGTPVSGDFNGDGHPDFAIPTSLGPVIIMLGHGDGTFQQGASISASQPFGAVAGDFNGDGKLDLAVGNRGTNGSIAIYLGNGDGTFTAGQVYPASPAADYQILASGDFNRDGIPDLVVTDHAHDQVAVLLGNGDGTFQSASLFVTGPQPWNLAVGDINGDGNADLVIANDISDAQGNNITLLLGNGDGTFKQGTYLKGGVSSSGSVALADFNGDGVLDIAATEEPANNVFVFLGNGDGTFQPKTTYTMNKGPYYITTGDFNQDGKKDLITANAEGASIGVLLGNGDGTFQVATTFPTNSREAIYVDVQDFNGDNQVDVVAVTHNGLQVYLAGNAQTAQFSPFSVTGCGTQSIVATYNGDTNYATSTSPVESVSQNGLATTLSVVQTPQNPVYGQTVTLTATLTPYVNGSNTSDGMSVMFYDGTTKLGSGILSSGVAILTVTSLATGPHSFTAVFAGDCANFTGSTSVAVLATVGKATPTITWANPAAIAYPAALSSTQLNATASVPGTFAYTPAVGNVPPAGTDTLSVTFTPTDTVNYGPATSTVPITVTTATLAVTAQNATRAYGTPNPTFSGSVTGALNGDTFTESFTTAATSTSAPGTYAIVPSAVGTNLADYTQAVTNGVLTITQASTTLSTTASATAISQGQSVTFSATVASTSTGTPTGTVSFFSNGSPLATNVPLVNGTATYSTTALPFGNDVITASYSGDTNFAGSTASAVSVAVAKDILNIAAANATRAYGTPNPTFTGTITGAQNGDTFTESFTTTATTTSVPGTYAIVPSVSGTNLAQYQQAVTNGTLTITQASTTLSTAASAMAISQGQSVTFSATVASTSTGTPTGTVSFFNNGSPLAANVPLVNGTATYSTTALPSGNDAITASYSGDTNFAGSTASAVSVAVAKDVLNITAANATRAYGTPNPTFTGTITGEQNGDTFTENFTTTATTTSVPGTYAIVPSVSGTNLAQYQQAVTNGTLTITQASTTLSTAASAMAISQGQSVTFSATVVSTSTGTPTGTVSFFDNGSPLATNVPLTNGTATYSTTALPYGSDAITASYSGDTNFAGSTASAVSVAVAKDVLNITAANATRVYGASNPTFTGTVTGAQNGDTFTESFTTTATMTSAPGTYAIVPSASGTNLAQYQQAVTNGTLTITQASTTLSTAASAMAISQGQSVTFSATVASTSTGTPTGTVSFFDNGSPLATNVPLTNGTATYSTTALPYGSDAITASYSGDTNFAGSTASAVSVAVAKDVLNITAANATRVYGASNPTFTGTVTGAQNGDTFTESFTTTATMTSAPGTYAIVPSASGTNLAQYQQAVTNGTLTITKASVNTTIALSGASITQGQNETVTATVASGTSGTPTGTVTFFSNGNQLGTATLTNGTATYATTSLPVGNNVITFTYGGDTNFTTNTAGQTSGANSVAVAAPTPLDFSFQMSNSSGLTGTYGQSVQVTLQLAPTAGQYPGPVQFAVSGTPAVAATYSFSPATVAANAGSTNVTMTIQLQALANLNRAPATSGRFASIALGLFLLPLASVRRLRRSGQRLGRSIGLSALLLLCLGAALSITGCGSGTPATAKTSPVSDSIVVNATSGSVQHSVTVNLQVQ